MDPRRADLRRPRRRAAVRNEQPRRDGQDEAPEGGKNRYYCCSLLLRLDLQKRMGLGLGDAAPKSKTKLPGAAQRRR